MGPNGRGRRPGLGTICFYQANSPEALYEHVRAADLPADEVVKISLVDVARPDPSSPNSRGDSTTLVIDSGTDRERKILL